MSDSDLPLQACPVLPKVLIYALKLEYFQNVNQKTVYDYAANDKYTFMSQASVSQQKHILIIIRNHDT